MELRVPTSFIHLLVFFYKLFLPEWKETEKPLLVLQSVGEVEERRLETMLVTLHSEAYQLNLVSAQNLYCRLFIMGNENVFI